MSGLTCDQLSAATAGMTACAQTSDGTQFTTHCLYPSFDPVQVYVIGFGEGFKVHDGAGAARTAWEHGRGQASVAKALAEQALAYQLKVVENSLEASVDNRDWLASAILAVANASAAAAHASLESASLSTEDDLRRKIEIALKSTLNTERIAKEYPVIGRSGKEYRFDFAARLGEGDRWLLIDAVAPHHVSIASKYVSFADTGSNHEELIGRYAVFDRRLEPADAALLQQVADLVPIAALSDGLRRELAA